MSNPLTAVTSTVADVARVPIAGVKSKPVVWALIFLVLALVVLRYRTQIANFLRGLPGVGPTLGKVIGGFALLALGGSDAAAANAVAEGSSSWPLVAGILGVLVVLKSAVHLLGGRVGAAGWNFPVPYSADLKSDGASVVTLVPSSSAEVPATFKIEGFAGHVGGAWQRATAICGRLRTVLDQPAAGSSTINADQLPRVIGGLEILSDTFGTLLTKETGTGPVLKHLIEFVGQGYAYGDYPRAQIAAADGDTTVDLYFCYPFAQLYLKRPHDTTPWVGWLNKTVINFSLAVSTALDGVSTGAVLKASTTLQMWLDYHLDQDLELTTLPYWQQYTRSANGNTIMLENIGAAKGLKGVEPFSRILGVFEHTDQAGMGGPDGADNLTEFYCPALGIQRLVNVDSLFRAYRAYAIRRSAVVGGNGTSALHNGAGNPETMAATPSATLSSATAMYIPIRAPSADLEVTKAPKLRGDLEITQRYTTTPSSGTHRFTFLELKQYTKDMKQELKARANRAGNSTQPVLADGSDIEDVYSDTNPRRINSASRLATLPVEIVERGK